MLTSLKRNVMVFSEPVDMRRSYNGLHAMVREHNVLSGDLFLFVAKNRKRAKCLFWDGSGLNIWMKRLEKGMFADVWRRERLTTSELKLFFAGSKLVCREVSPKDLTNRYTA